MKIKYFALLIVFWVFNACEKEIVLHPENSEQKLSVEAMFTDFPVISYIRITKSKGIYEPITNHEQITDADVKLIDLDTNDTIVFQYDNSPDVEKYKSSVPGIENHTYLLDITAEGQHITTTQTMTSKVNLDRVISVPTDEDPNLYYLKMKFNDPPGQEDYYLIIMQPQDPTSGLESRFSVLSDMSYNSSEKTLSITDEFFHKDENWVILFFHINRENFNYFQVIHRAMKSLVNGAHPFYGLSLGNPQSTIENNETMGYFFASPVTASPIRIGN